VGTLRSGRGPHWEQEGSGRPGLYAGRSPRPHWDRDYSFHQRKTTAPFLPPLPQSASPLHNQVSLLRNLCIQNFLIWLFVKDNSGLKSYLTKTGLRWKVRLRIDRRLREWRGFRTKKGALAFRDKIRAERHEGILFPGKYRRAKQGELFQATIDLYLPTIGHKKSARDEPKFAKWWGAWFNDQYTQDVTQDSIRKARQALLESGVRKRRSLATANRYVAWLKHLLNAALEREVIVTNPAKAIKPFPEPPGPTLQLSPAQEQKLYTVLRQDAPLARFAVLTGLRQAEQFGLTWEQIVWEQHALVLPTTKAGEAQYLPLSAEAETILKGIPRTSNKVFPLDPKSWYKKVFVPACHKAGLPDKVTWHTLKHTFNSRLAMTGANEATLMVLGRWKSPKMIQRYVHLYRDHLDAAIERAARFGR